MARELSERWAAIAVVTIFILAGCTKSPQGSVEELVKTRQPSFGGMTNRRFISPSSSFVLNGECDPLSYGLFYSYDQATWTEIPEGCSNGTFSITVSVTTTVTVYVRSQTKFDFTQPGIATIQIERPPTSPFMKLTSSGAASDDSATGTQNEMNFFSAETLANGINIVKTSLVDIIYGEE